MATPILKPALTISAISFRATGLLSATVKISFCILKKSLVRLPALSRAPFNCFATPSIAVSKSIAVLTGAARVKPVAMVDPICPLISESRLLLAIRCFSTLLKRSCCVSNFLSSTVTKEYFERRLSTFLPIPPKVRMASPNCRWFCLTLLISVPILPSSLVVEPITVRKLPASAPPIVITAFSFLLAMLNHFNL